MAGTSLLSDAELHAALTEAEQAVAAIPDLDDGRSSKAAAAAAADAKSPGRKPAAPGAEAADPSAPAAPARPRFSLAALLRPLVPVVSLCARYALLALTLFDRPFSGISPVVKQIIGFAAAASLVASLTALFLIPTILPRRDALTFLREKVADLRMNGGNSFANDELDTVHSPDASDVPTTDE